MVDRTEEEKEEIKEESKPQKEPKEPNISLTAIRRMLKAEGVYKIEQPALQEIRFILQDIVKDMSRNIVIFTKHRKAKISTKEDVLLAIR